MNRWQAWFSHIATIAVGLSGLIYLWMKYFIQTEDPFSVVNHPLQPFFLSLHVFTAPLLVFLFGLIFESHIQRKLGLGTPTNRRSGLVALITFAIMTLSGYALQITSAEIWSRSSFVLHIASSFVFLVSYVVHQAVTLRLWLATRQASSRSGLSSFVRRRASTSAGD